MLSPSFDGDELSYTANTTNATNTIKASAESASSVIEIKNGDVVVENGKAITWKSGENIVTIKVTNGASSTTYRVVVTKA